LSLVPHIFVISYHSFSLVSHFRNVLLVVLLIWIVIFPGFKLKTFKHKMSASPILVPVVLL
jgi:hypothetical protein